MDKFLPNATAARQDLIDEDDLEHGIDCFEFPRDTSLHAAQLRVRQLEHNPHTAYITTNDPLDFLTELQHWLGKGYYVGDSSAVICRPDLQIAKLFRTLD